MAQVDVGVRGLEFEVPDDWNESQVRDATRARYPFLFPDLVAASEAARAQAPGPSPIEVPASSLRPSELPLAPVAVDEPPTPVLPPAPVAARPPADAAEANYRDKFGVRTPTRTGDPSFLEALAKEYLGTVSSAAPSIIESIRMLDAMTGSQALADLLAEPAQLTDAGSIQKRAADRIEAVRNLDPMFEEARRLRAAGESAYDYNREALPGWQQKPAEWIGAGLGSATTFLPSVLLGPGGPLAVAGGMSFSPAYEEARRAGATPEAAMKQALVEAGLEAASEYFLGVPGTLARMLRKPAKKAALDVARKEAGESLGKTLTKAGAQEGAEEVISGAGKDLSAAYLTGTDTSRGVTGSTTDESGTPNWVRFLERRLDDAIGGAVGGVAFTPAMREGARLRLQQVIRDEAASKKPVPPVVGRLDPEAFASPRVRARARGLFRTGFDDAARRQSVEGMLGIGRQMQDLGYDDAEIQALIDESVSRLWEPGTPMGDTVRNRTPRSGETLGTPPATEEARTLDRPEEPLDVARMRAEGFALTKGRPRLTESTFARVRKAVGIPKDVEVVFNTTDRGLRRGGDGRLYTLPGLWQDGRITIWTRNIKSEEHLRRVLAEENNHRILSSPDGQRVLAEFLAEYPVDAMLASAPAWLREELAKYEGNPDDVIADEFVAKLGSDPAWKRWLAEWWARIKHFFGRNPDKAPHRSGDLTATEAARLLLRQVQDGKVSVASTVATPVVPSASVAPADPGAGTPSGTPPTGTPPAPPSGTPPTGTPPTPPPVPPAPPSGTPPTPPTPPVPPAPPSGTPPVPPATPDFATPAEFEAARYRLFQAELQLVAADFWARKDKSKKARAEWAVRATRLRAVVEELRPRVTRYGDDNRRLVKPSGAIVDFPTREAAQNHADYNIEERPGGPVEYKITVKKDGEGRYSVRYRAQMTPVDVLGEAAPDAAPDAVPDAVPAPAPPAAKTWPTPNASGVFDKKDAEALSFKESDVTAAIHVLEVRPAEWVAAASYDIGAGGMGSPLTAPTFPSRAAAVGRGAWTIYVAATRASKEAGLSEAKKAARTKLAAWASALAGADAAEPPAEPAPPPASDEPSPTEVPAKAKLADYPWHARAMETPGKELRAEMEKAKASARFISALGSALTTWVMGVRAGTVLERLDLEVRLEKFTLRALTELAHRLGIPRPPTKKELVSRLAAYRIVAYKYQPEDGETPDAARDRIAAINTGAALDKDLAVIAGFKGVPKPGKAAQLVAKAIALREAQRKFFVTLTQQEAAFMAEREGREVPDWLRKEIEAAVGPVEWRKATAPAAPVPEPAPAAPEPAPAAPEPAPAAPEPAPAAPEPAPAAPEPAPAPASKSPKSEATPPKTTPEGLAKEAKEEIKTRPGKEGPRVKKELVRRLEEALAKAPDVAPEAGSPDATVTITVPGDGTFRLKNSKEVIQKAIDRASALETSTSMPKGDPSWLTPARPVGNVDPESWIDSSEPTHRVSVNVGTDSEGKPMFVPSAGKRIEVPGAPEELRFWVATRRGADEFAIYEEGTGLRIVSGTRFSKMVSEAAERFAKLDEEGRRGVVARSRAGTAPAPVEIPKGEIALPEIPAKDAPKPAATPAPASAPAPAAPEIPAETLAEAAPHLAVLRTALARPLKPKDRVAVTRTGADLARVLTKVPALRGYRAFASTVLADLGDAARPFLQSWYHNARISDTKHTDYDSEAATQAIHAEGGRASLGEVYEGIDDAIRDSGRRAVSGELRAGRGGGGRPGAKVVRAELIPPPREFATEGTYAAKSGFRLTHHQVLGVNAITTLFDANPDGAAFLLADGTGFGKTAQMVAAIDQYWKLHPTARVLLVSQNKQILKTRFLADMARMGIAVPPGAELVTETYNGLPKLDRKKPFDLAAFDEAHNLKNDTSKKSIAAALIKATHRIYATATPMDKPTHAAYFLAEALGEDEAAVAAELGYSIETREDPYTHEEYTVAVLRTGFSWFKVWANIIAYRDALIGSGAMLRREYPFFGDIIHDRSALPPEAKTSQAALIRHFDRLVDSARGPLARKNYAGQKTLTLSRWTELQKVSRALGAAQDWLVTHPKGQVLIVAETAGTQSFPVKLPGSVERYDKDKGKTVYELPGALESIRSALEEDGVAVASIFGDNPKAEEVERFQSGEARVGLTTPQSGGAGIDADDTVGDRPRLLLMLSKNFAADIFDQILGRVSRMNTKSEALAIFLATDSYSDARRDAVLERKLKTLRAIQGGEDADIAAGPMDVDRASLGDEVTTTVDGTERTMPRAQALKRVQGLDATLRRLLDCLATT